MASIFDEIDAIEVSRLSVFDEIDAVDTRNVERRVEDTGQVGSATQEPIVDQGPRPTLGERAWLNARVAFSRTGFGMLARTDVPFAPEGATFGQAAKAMPAGTNALAGLMNLFGAPGTPEETVALRKQYEDMPGAEGIAERSAAVGGFLLGSTPSPENIIPVGRGATLLRTAARGAGTIGSLNAALDVAEQGLDVSQGIQSEFDFERLAIAAAAGGAIGAVANVLLDPKVLGKVKDYIKRRLSAPDTTPEAKAAITELEKRLTDLETVATQEKVSPVLDAPPENLVGQADLPVKIQVDPAIDERATAALQVAIARADGKAGVSAPGVRSIGNATADPVPTRPPSTPEEDLAAWISTGTEYTARIEAAKQLQGADRMNAIEQVIDEFGKLRESLKNRHFGGENPSEEILVGMREGKTPAQVQRPDEVPTTAPELPATGSEGFIKAPVLQAIAGSGAGAVIGSTQGDTPQERISNALIGAGIGASSPFLLASIIDAVPKKQAPLPRDVAEFAKAFEAPPKKSRFGELKEIPARTYRQFVSEFSPLNKAEKTLRREAGLPAADLPIARKFEQLRGAAGKAEADVIRFDKAVAEPVAGREREFNLYIGVKRTIDRLTKQEEFATKKAADARLAQTEYETLRAGLKAGSTMEKARKVVSARKRFRKLREEAKVAQTSRAVGDYTLPQAQKILDDLSAHIGPKALSLFDATGQAYQRHMDDALRLQVLSGRMSEKTYDAIKAMNDFYAPFKIIKHIDDIDMDRGAGRKIDTTAQLTAAIKGVSAEDFKIEDILLASRQNLVRSRVLAEKNLKMQELYGLLSLDDQHQFVKILNEGDLPREGYARTSVFVNGEKVELEVSREIAEAIKGLDATQMSVALKAAALAAYPLRLGATGANVAFQMANIALADFPRLSLISKYGLGSGKDAVGRVADTIRLPLDYMQAMASSIRGNFGSPDALYMQWLESGAARSTIQDSLADMSFGAKQGIVPTRRIRQPRGVLDTIGAIGNSIEETTKIVGLKRGLRAEGWSPTLPKAQQAQIMERVVAEVRNYAGSPDFGRKGTHGINANLLFMFFNARLQGVDADARRLLGKDGAKVAAATWAKIGAAIGTPTVALWLHNQTGQNAVDFGKVPKEERDNYWMLPRYDENGAPLYFTNSDGQQVRDYYRIPKRETVKLFANVTESFLDFNKKRDPDALWQFGVSFMENVSPLNVSGRNFNERIESVISSTNPLIKVPIELGLGRNTFFHRETIPQRLQGGFGGVSPELQFKDSTPKLFIEAAEAFPDFLPERLRSPLYLEQLVQGMSAGLVTQFVTGKVPEGRAAWTGAPGLKRFARSQYVENEEMLDMVRKEDRAETDMRLTGMRNAREFIDAIKVLPQEQRRPALKAALIKDPMLLKYMAETMEAETKGFTFQDSVIQGLGIESGARSQFYRDAMQNMSKEEKRTFLLDQVKKGLLSEEVLGQLLSEQALGGRN